MEDQLKISALSRILYSLMITNGIAGLRKNQSEFEVKQGYFQDVLLAIKPFGIDTLNLDNTYYFTTFENWKTIIELLYNKIIIYFKWEAEKFDCDNRAMLFSALASVIFKLNTVGQVYCEVKTPNGGYLHWANIIIDKDNIAYLLDLDNGGRYQKITGNKMVMGNATYTLKSLRIG
jgi:hypothetical protein